MYDRFQGIKIRQVWGQQKLRGGILGDDMGLGKTIQVIAFVSRVNLNSTIEERQKVQRWLFGQLSAIMCKTGTFEDVQPSCTRKERSRERQSKNLPCSPTMFGPTALIVCPSTLVNNVSRFPSWHSTIDSS